MIGVLSVGFTSERLLVLCGQHTVRPLASSLAHRRCLINICSMKQISRI